MDIVENLKALLEVQGLDLSKTLNHNDISFILVQCLDEIERLREALAAVKECIDDKSYIDAEMIIDTALKGDE